MRVNHMLESKAVDMSLEAVGSIAAKAVVPLFLFLMHLLKNKLVAQDKKIEELRAEHEERLDNMYTKDETRELAEDLSRPTEVLVRELQKDIEEGKERSRRVEDKLDELKTILLQSRNR